MEEKETNEMEVAAQKNEKRKTKETEATLESFI